MSILKKTSEKVIASGTRALHRSTEVDYLKIGEALSKKNPNETNPQRFFKAPPILANSQQLVQNTLRTSVAMKEQGLVPLVTAMPAGTEVLFRLYKTLYPPKVDRPFFKYLRPPIPEFMLPAAEAMENIPNPKSFQKSARYDLISTSPALLGSSYEPLEEPGGWLEAYHAKYRAENNYHILGIFDQLMRLQGFDKYPGYRDTIHQNMWNIIRLYGRLQVGKLMVIGIPPELISEIAYDALAYHFPTGNPVMDVLNHPEKYKAQLVKNGHRIITLVCSEKLLNPDSGIQIVDGSHPKEVEAFCLGRPFTPISKVEILSRALGEAPDPGFEQRQAAAREQVDELLSHFFEKFNRNKHHPAAMMGAFSNSDVCPIESIDHLRPELGV